MFSFENALHFVPGPSGSQPSIPIRVQNFSTYEAGFCWQVGRWGEVSFDFDGASPTSRKLCDLILDVDVFKIDGQFLGQDLLTYLNGLRVGNAFIEARRMLIVPFEERLLRPRDNTLVLDTPDAVSPMKFGLQDGRVLGAQLFSMQIRRAE
jgi:hypothetical protein